MPSRQKITIVIAVMVMIIAGLTPLLFHARKPARRMSPQLKEVVGIGVAMRINQRTHDLLVMDVISNSPAADAGITNGLIISKVDDVPMNGKLSVRETKLTGRERKLSVPDSKLSRTDRKLTGTETKLIGRKTFQTGTKTFVSLTETIQSVPDKDEKMAVFSQFQEKMRGFHVFQGLTGNSPAFQGWETELSFNRRVPSGRQNMVAIRQHLSSLTGLLMTMTGHPSAKALGYFHRCHGDIAPYQKIQSPA